MSDTVEVVRNLYGITYRVLIPEGYEAIAGEPMQRADVVATSFNDALEVLYQHVKAENVELLQCQLEAENFVLLERIQEEQKILTLTSGDTIDTSEAIEGEVVDDGRVVEDGE